MSRYSWMSAFLADARHTIVSVAAIACLAIGALLVLHVHIVYPLVTALLILTSVALTVAMHTREARRRA